MNNSWARLRPLIIAGVATLSAWTVVSALSPTRAADPILSVRIGSSNTAEIVPPAYLLGDGRAVVIGAADVVAGVWVLSRDRADDKLRLSHVGTSGILSDRALPLNSAGIQAGLAPTATAVWAGAGSRVVRVDRLTGATKVYDLDQPSDVVSGALRAPDGSVLGLGNITSLAVDAEGQNVWIARFAANSITVLRAIGGKIREVAIGNDHDADRLALAQDQLWFTVNSGPGGRLAAAVGHLNTQTLTVSFLPMFARSLTIRADGVHALGDTWARIDPATERVTPVLSLKREIDSSTETLDAAGNLVVRGAGQTKLFVVSPQGMSRTIRYDQGRFTNSAGTRVATNSPLAFATTDAASRLWFAPRGGPIVFAVP
jgi:hypothetical protein